MGKAGAGQSALVTASSAGVASDGIILDPNNTLPCGLNLEGTCVWPDATLVLDVADSAQIVLWSRLTLLIHIGKVWLVRMGLNHTMY